MGYLLDAKSQKGFEYHRDYILYLQGKEKRYEDYRVKK